MDYSTPWYVFVNPHAGSFKKWPEVERQMIAQELSYNMEQTQSIAELNSRVTTLLQQGARKFIAVGGDGSCHVMINALVNQEAAAVAELVFANISCGTGNDWQRGRGWPRDTYKQIATIKRGNIEKMDLGRVSYPHREQVVYFFNMLGLSYDAYVVHNLAQGEKKKMGALIYLWSVVKYIFQYQIPVLRLEFNDRVIEKKMYTVNAGLGTHAGSGMQICPHAKRREDQLAILIANDMSKGRVLWESIRFYTGTIEKSNKTETYFTKELSAAAVDTSLQVEADGELLPEGPIRVLICPNYLNTIAL